MYPLLIFILLSLSKPALADIVGGDEVRPTDPIRESTVALFDPSPEGRGGALCTASLIGNDTAITAAHCIGSQASKPVLIFGNDIHAADASARRVTAVAVNPKWAKHQGRGMDQGDIALVKFPGGLPEGYHSVKTAESESLYHKGRRAILAGYGISNARRKSGAGVLRRTNVEIQDERAGKSEMILDQSHGRGACHGDSGGPAFIRSAGSEVLAGITNRGYPASAPDDCAHRVVYTKVSAYQPWIKKTEASLHARSTMMSIKHKISRRLHTRRKAPRH